jgi:hypothetical protein
MNSTICANDGHVHGKVGKERTVEGGDLAIIPVERCATSKEDTSLVLNRVTVSNHILGQLIVNSPQDCTDAVPPEITKCTEGIKVWLYPDVILEEIFICLKADNAVYLKQHKRKIIIYLQG